MKYFYFYIPLLIWLFAVDIAPRYDNEYQNDKKIQKDSISLWIEYSNNMALDFPQRKLYLDKAFKKTLVQQNDSLKNVYLSKIGLNYYRLNDSLSFRKVNRLSIKLAMQLGDSTTLAYDYWDLGNYFSKKEVKDSAYYSYFQAQKIYEGLENHFYSGRMLLNMAVIQSDSKDYTGSEVTTIKAIELLKPLKKHKQLYACYNNLGVIFNELKDYDKALFYHNEALVYQEKISGKNSYKFNTLNNIGVVYKNKQEHAQAIKYYQEALYEKDLKEKNTKLYAMLLDNLAYSQYKLNDTIGVGQFFYRSLKIRDSINDLSGIIINKLHLAEFNASYNDTIKALQLANEAKDLAYTSKNHRDVLAALLLLSKLDTKKSYSYANRYIALNDSLLQQERAIRNKFARIRFETDEFIEENVLLSAQKKRILIFLGVLVLLSALLYIIRDQRLKNIKLKLEREQQKANEEIYNLMLSQQHKIDEGKRNEKKRISEELHDGVLGKLFGARLILGTLNDLSDKESILKRGRYIQELQEIEEEVRNVSHELHAKSLDADIGYIELIENLLEKQSLITKFKYEFNCDNDISWDEIKGDIKMNLYRIIQEATQNINKYAKAKHVKVSCRVDKNILYLTIRDDGIGFNASTKSLGIGLKNIKSRVHDLGGTVMIESEPNLGTSIFIETPY